jgi:hypothetical protein
MCLIFAAESSTDACCQLIGRKRSIGFNHPSFGMRPFGFNWVEPGTLDRQATDQDAHPLTTAFHLAIVCPDPGGYFLADMPRGIIPYQSQDSFVHCFQPGATPFKKLNRDIADGTPVHETEQDFLVDLPILFHPPQQQPVTSQCFRLWVFFGLSLFHQAQWLTLFSPGRQVGLGKTTPPGLITIALDPIPIRVAPADESVAALFLRSYAGSGLVIQCLARFHFTPRRSSVWRIVSSLTRRAVRPCSKLTSAASSKVHKLLGLSNSLGLRCNSARNFSALSSSKTAWVVWGRREPGFRASTPRSSKARITLRTVWSSQPRNSAIAGAVSPRALATRIWQRRTVKLSDERRPAFNCSRSSDVSSRTKIGFLMPGSIPYSRISCLRLH